jgi:phage-related protein
MAKLQEIKDVNKDKESYVKGYRIALNTKGIKTTGFTTDDELNVDYKKGKITITKKEN